MMVAPRHPPPKRLAALLGGAAELQPGLDREVLGLTFDSRQVGRGSVFFARCGVHVDATRFAGQASAAGACAMVVEAGDARGAAGETPPRQDDAGMLRIAVADVTAAAGAAAHRFFDAPSESMPVVAITGTNGKTSVCHFVAQALELLGHGPAAVLGTLGAGMSCGGSLRHTGLTTADCIANHALLADFRDAGARVAVMEASSHALDQGRLAGLRIDTAVFTNISRDHLDYHGDMETYARAKGRLFATPGLRAAVINAADPAAPRIRARIGAEVQLVDYALGTDVPAAVRGRLLSADATGVTLEVRLEDDVLQMRSALIGMPAALNLLAALGVLLARGINPYAAADALCRVQPVPGRMQPLGGDGQPLVVVDYAHTPAALAGAAEALRAICRARLWCVFGAGGDRDHGKRALMGEAAARIADRVLITDDNPRGEDGDAIAAAIMSGVTVADRGKVRIERERARAIELAVGEAGPHDVVLVAGKGHERYQEVAGERRPFSDVAAARAALEARRS